MGAIDNLNSNISALQAAATAIEAKVDALVAAGTPLPPLDNEVAIQAAADAVAAVTVGLNAKAV